MQNAFSFGLAKNGVNGLPGVRRAASASQIGGRISSPSTPMSVESSVMGGWGIDTPVALSVLPSVASSPVAFEGGHGLRTGEAYDKVIQHATRLYASEDEFYLSKRGTSVNKTNPFIGYFQTGIEESETLTKTAEVSPPSLSTPVRRVPCRTQSSVTLSSISSLYSSSPVQSRQERTPWIRTQSSCIPTLFNQPKLHQQDRASFFESVKFKPSVLTVEGSPKETGGNQQCTSIVASHHAALPRPVTSSSYSRFENEFEVLGSLGEGGQGSVVKVRSKIDGCYYAIKKVVLPCVKELEAERLESQALREVRLMASMAPHPNVVRYHTAWTEVAASPSSLSSESHTGSDLLLRNEYSARDLQRHELDLLEEEDDAMNQFFFEDSTYSSSGFAFEDEEDSSVGLSFDEEDNFGQTELETKAVVPIESVMRPQVTLYIQMELCGTPHSYENSILDQVKTSYNKNAIKHSNLGAWLRSSVDKRLAWSNTSATHQEGLRLFLSAVEGVAHMHSYGVIHRDLKPDNVFIHGEKAKIGDFGLSKSIFAESSGISPLQRLEEMGLSDSDHTTALGTLTYASPEQLGYRFSNTAMNITATRLKSAKYSTKSDIFALGVMLLETCCPFTTMMERSQVLTGVRHGVVPQKAREVFPLEMDLVLRMTSVDPSDRPTTDEVCEQLRQIIAASSTKCTPASALDELLELQTRLAAAVRKVRDRSPATLQLELLVLELSDKVQNAAIALA